MLYRKHLLVLILLACLSSFNVLAQDCPEFPAPCPETLDYMHDGQRMLKAFVTPDEFRMQNRLRAFVAGQFDRLAKAKHWTYYEHTEWTDGDAGTRSDIEIDTLAAPFRGPHPFYLSYIFIVNADSLQAWKDWRSTELTDKSNTVVNNLKNAGEVIQHDALINQYTDSVNLYAKKFGEYVAAHQSEYQKALTSGDEKTVNRIQAGQQALSDRMNAFSDKVNARQAALYAAPEKESGQLQTLAQQKKILFRNASLIRITVEFNPQRTTACGEKTELVGRLSVPHSYYASILHNAGQLEEKFLSFFVWATDNGLVLLGDWSKADNGYFQSNALYNDHARNKLIKKTKPSTQIQTIAVHMEGRPDYIEAFTTAFDWQSLYGLMETK